MQARLRAQLGDRPKYSGERRRRSVVVASIVLTITAPLRGSYPLLCNLQAALIRSCGASFACMELTIISRFQRLQASTKFYFIHYFIVFQCPQSIAPLRGCGLVMTLFTCRRHVPTRDKKLKLKLKLKLKRKQFVDSLTQKNKPAFLFCYGKKRRLYACGVARYGFAS